MIRRWIRHHLPSVEHFERLPLLRHFKSHLAHPNLWALNRRSIAGGVAAGLFCGLIPGPFQVAAAFVWVLLCKVNLPVAFATTWYTNPITIVPLYIVAVAYGDWLLGSGGGAVMHPVPDWDWHNFSGSLHALLDWMLGLGPSLAVGLPALMITLSAVGYCMVRVGWNIGVRCSWARRKARRAKSIH
ncbi:MAG TPA: DUF2062 domain-containing protein [Limnobacter sp.]|uniref:DUF2062 domain-containing protein n=1 Tax=Limnobacter sp. TaxID=2003368 RepID=UPI002EDB9E3F